MKFFRSRAGAAAVLVFVVIFSTVFGSHRSLNAVRSDVLTIFEGDSDGFGHSVKGDLETRMEVGANLYAVAERYLDVGSGAIALEELSVTLGLVQRSEAKLKDDVKAIIGTLYQDQLVAAIDGVFAELKDAELSEQDAKYISNFQAQMESIEATIARDPYTAAAKEFNETTLGTFPASLLGPLTGVHELPIYH